MAEVRLKTGGFGGAQDNWHDVPLRSFGAIVGIACRYAHLTPSHELAAVERRPADVNPSEVTSETGIETGAR